MRRWRTLGLVCLAGAAASLGWGALQGDLQVALFLVFPVVYGSGPWAVLGIGLVMAGFVALFLDAAASLPGAPPPEGGRPGRDPFETEARGEAPEGPWPGAETGGRDEDGSWFRGGGVIMLGPIPIVLGSDKRTTMIVMALAVLLLALGLAWWVLVAG